jgi:DNA-binding transcriptional LysR family regulator
MSDLDALRSLAEVCRCGSVTEAAQRLGISQPTVSGHLRALEARFGRPLVERHGRGVKPTAFAEDVAARVGPAADALAETLEDTAPGPRGPVRLAGPGTYLAVRTVPALSAFDGPPVRLIAESDPDALARRGAGGRRRCTVLGRAGARDRATLRHHRDLRWSVTAPAAEA